MPECEKQMSECQGQTLKGDPEDQLGLAW